MEFTLGINDFQKKLTFFENGAKMFDIFS